MSQSDSTRFLPLQSIYDEQQPILAKAPTQKRQKRRQSAPAQAPMYLIGEVVLMHVNGMKLYAQIRDLTPFAIKVAWLYLQPHALHKTFGFAQEDFTIAWQDEEYHSIDSIVERTGVFLPMPIMSHILSAPMEMQRNMSLQMTPVPEIPAQISPTSEGIPAPASTSPDQIRSSFSILDERPGMEPTAVATKRDFESLQLDMSLLLNSNQSPGINTSASHILVSPITSFENILAVDQPVL